MENNLKLIFTLIVIIAVIGATTAMVFYKPPAKPDVIAPPSPSQKTDSQQIVFSMVVDGNEDIYIVNTGGDVKRLTTGPSSEYDPFLIGNNLFFVSTQDDPRGEIYLKQANRVNWTRLTDSHASDSQPVVTKDEKLVFLSNRIYATNRNISRVSKDPELFVLDMANHTLTKAIVNKTVYIFEEHPIQVQTDGSIVFQFIINKSGNLTNINTGIVFPPGRLTATAVKGVVYPVFSPRHDMIAFEVFSGRLNGVEIFISDVNGSMRRALTRNNFQEQNPQWSPDGNFVAFLRKVNQTHHQIVIVNKATNQEEILVTGSVKPNHTFRWAR